MVAWPASCSTIKSTCVDKRSAKSTHVSARRQGQGAPRCSQRVAPDTAATFPGRASWEEGVSLSLCRALALSLSRVSSTLSLPLPPSLSFSYPPTPSCASTRAVFLWGGVCVCVRTYAVVAHDGLECLCVSARNHQQHTHKRAHVHAYVQKAKRRNQGSGGSWVCELGRHHILRHGVDAHSMDTCTRIFHKRCRFAKRREKRRKRRRKTKDERRKERKRKTRKKREKKEEPSG